MTPTRRAEQTGRMVMDELRLADDEIEAVILPAAGARFHRIRAFGHDLLRTPDDPAEHVRDPFFWGAFMMAPWCNRIRPEPVELGGRRVTLRPNFGDGSAIHGQVYASHWRRVGDGTLLVRGGGDGWPWDYEVGLRLELGRRRLLIDLTLANKSHEAMPAGLGIHPWFRCPLRLAIDADAVYADRWASSVQPEPVVGPYDMRRVAEMAPDLDATWTSLREPPIVLEWPAAAIRLTVRSAGSANHVVAASPPAVDAIAVEPQTHAPQGLRRLTMGEPGALALLSPGEVLRLSVEMIFESFRNERPARPIG